MPLDASCRDDGLGPGVGVRPDGPHLPEQIGDAAFEAVDLHRVDVVHRGAESTVIVLGVDRDLGHLLVEDAHDPAVERAQTSRPRYSGGTE